MERWRPKKGENPTIESRSKNKFRPENENSEVTLDKQSDRRKDITHKLIETEEHGKNIVNPWFNPAPSKLGSKAQPQSRIKDKKQSESLVAPRDNQSKIEPRRTTQIKALMKDKKQSQNLVDPRDNQSKIEPRGTTQIKAPMKDKKQSRKLVDPRDNQSKIEPRRTIQSENVSEMLSFADMLKKAKPLVQLVEEKPTKVPVKRVKASRREYRLDRPWTNETSKRPTKTHPNRISAETYSKIGQTKDDEKYVMGSEANRMAPRETTRKRFDLEVEFVGDCQADRQDVEIEFVEPVLTDKFVNKISAGTYRRIGRTEEEEDKYVMSARQQPNSSKIEEESKPPEQPVIKDIHDMIREKLKRKEELTHTEREVIRQKRRDRRMREKETKRRLREDELRKQMLSNKGVKLGFISNDILRKVTGTPSGQSHSGSTSRTIKFQQDEYPDLGTTPTINKKQGIVAREVRRSEWHSADQDTGSEWETDHSDYQEHQEEDVDCKTENDFNAPDLIVQSPTTLEPLSYSSILKHKKVANVEITPAKKSEIKKDVTKSSDGGGGTKIDPASSVVKKKVKAKSAIEVDLFEAITRKEPKSKKKNIEDALVKRPAAVLGGKIKREPEKQVRNQLDSSAPARKRGKEREGGKKKKKSLMKKIIMAEKARKRGEREEAAARRQKRIQDGVHLEPLVVAEEISHEEVVKKEDTASPEDLVTEGLQNLEIDSESKVASANDSRVSTDKKRAKSESDNPPKQDTSNKNEIRPPTKEERVKLSIHSRKYRDYCDQDLSKDLETYVTNLMVDLIRFQDRQYFKDPLKAKIRRRYCVGLRETSKFLKVKKVNCVILATDLEKISTEGGLDTAVDNIIRLCREQGVPVVFCLGRYKLGKACLRKAPVSCIAIMNQQGSDENFKNMVELSAQLRESYAAKLKFEIENLDVKTSSRPLRYSPGTQIEFTPRPASSLRYSPGIEFYPRGYGEVGEQNPQIYTPPYTPEYRHDWIGDEGWWGQQQQQQQQQLQFSQLNPDKEEFIPASQESIPSWQKVLNILKS